jgi:hypothetical protein
MHYLFAMTDAGFAQTNPTPPPAWNGTPPLPVPAPAIPGKTLGIVAFVLSFFVLANIAGLVLGIIALVKSKRVGYKNGLGIAAVVISAVGVLLTAVILATAIPALVEAGQTCARLGNGVHVIGNTTYTCTPTSFNEFTTSG